MTHINLLPWREVQRKEKQQTFLTMLGVMAVAGVAVVIIAHVLINDMIHNQESRNDYLQTEISKVNRRIKELKELEKIKQALLDRMEIIQQLQRSRPEIVHIFDELVTTLPDGMHLTSLSQTGNTLAISGRAESDARVSNYMRNLGASPWMADPVLSIIETRQAREGGDRKNTRSFSLNVKKTTPETETGSEGDV